MNRLEQLEQEVMDSNVKIHRADFDGTRLKGLYIDGNIALSDKLETVAEKSCILAEELGHHHTTVGNILDVKHPENAKQERRARLWAYNRQLGLYGIIRAFNQGCQNKFEVAEFLEVTEEFLEDALECYRDKYGVGTELDNYYIMFIPNLQILKMI